MGADCSYGDLWINLSDPAYPQSGQATPPVSLTLANRLGFLSQQQQQNNGIVGFFPNIAFGNGNASSNQSNDGLLPPPALNQIHAPMIEMQWLQSGCTTLKLTPHNPDFNFNDIVNQEQSQISIPELGNIQDINTDVGGFGELPNLDVNWTYPNIQIPALNLTIPHIQPQAPSLLSNATIPTNTLDNFTLPKPGQVTPITITLLNIADLLLQIQPTQIITSVGDVAKSKIAEIVNDIFTYINDFLTKLNFTIQDYNFEPLANDVIQKCLSFIPNCQIPIQNLPYSLINTFSPTTNRVLKQQMQSDKLFTALQNYLDTWVADQQLITQFQNNIQRLRQINLNRTITLNNVSGLVSQLLQQILDTKLQQDNVTLQNILHLFTLKGQMEGFVTMAKEVPLQVQEWRARIESNIDMVLAYSQRKSQEYQILYDRIKSDVTAYELQIQKLVNTKLSEHMAADFQNQLQMSLAKLAELDNKLTAQYVNQINELNSGLFNLAQTYFNLYEKLITWETLSAYRLRAEAMYAKELARYEAAQVNNKIAEAEKEELQIKLQQLSMIYQILMQEQTILHKRYNAEYIFYKTQLDTAQKLYEITQQHISLFPSMVEAANKELNAISAEHFVREATKSMTTYMNLYEKYLNILTEETTLSMDEIIDQTIAEAHKRATIIENKVEISKVSAAEDGAITTGNITDILADAEIESHIRYG
jgi:hypothetical protein